MQNVKQLLKNLMWFSYFVNVLLLNIYTCIAVVCNQQQLLATEQLSDYRSKQIRILKK